VLGVEVRDARREHRAEVVGCDAGPLERGLGRLARHRDVVLVAGRDRGLAAAATVVLFGDLLRLDAVEGDVAGRTVDHDHSSHLRIGSRVIARAIVHTRW